MVWVLLFVAIAYLVGSLSSALIICHLMKLPDPRTQGSGNAGATNMLRMGYKREAALVLAGDILKGLFIILLARVFQVSGLGLGLVGIAVVLGHIYPIYFKFNGGKGVATAFGVLLGLSPSTALFAAAVWIIMLAAFRYVSLASMTAAVVAVIFALFYATYFIFAITLIALILIATHHKNISRLFAGQENKFTWPSEK